MTEVQNGSSAKGWRLSKEIPLSVVLFLVVQTLTASWFLSSQNKTLNDLVAAKTKEETTRYTKEDATREREFQEQKYILLSNKMDESTRRIALLEGQVTELLNRARAQR